MYADKYVSRADDVPNQKHYAILVSDGVFIPGDERSRQAPGHGYPERTHEYLSYQVYNTQEKLFAAIEELEKGKKKFKVVEVTPINYTKKVTFELNVHK